MSDSTGSGREWRFYVEDMIAFASKCLAYTDGMDQYSFFSKCIADTLSKMVKPRRVELKDG